VFDGLLSALSERGVPQIVQMFIGLFWILLSSSLFGIGLLMGAAVILVIVHFFSVRTKTNRLARM
jgi:hypothetical protein